MYEGVQGPQGEPEPAKAEKVESEVVDFAVSTTIEVKTPQLEPEDTEAVVQLLARGVMEQIKPLTRREMLLRKVKDGVEARVEFYAVPRAAMREILNER